MKTFKHLFFTIFFLSMSLSAAQACSEEIISVDAMQSKNFVSYGVNQISGKDNTSFAEILTTATYHKKTSSLSPQDQEVIKEYDHLVKLYDVLKKDDDLPNGKKYEILAKFLEENKEISLFDDIFKIFFRRHADASIEKVRQKSPLYEGLKNLDKNSTFRNNIKLSQQALKRQIDKFAPYVLHPFSRDERFSITSHFLSIYAAKVLKSYNQSQALLTEIDFLKGASSELSLRISAPLSEASSFSYLDFLHFFYEGERAELTAFQNSLLPYQTESHVSPHTAETIHPVLLDIRGYCSPTDDPTEGTSEGPSDSLSDVDYPVIAINSEETVKYFQNRYVLYDFTRQFLLMLVVDLHREEVRTMNIITQDTKNFLSQESDLLQTKRDRLFRIPINSVEVFQEKVPLLDALHYHIERTGNKKLMKKLAKRLGK